MTGVQTCALPISGNGFLDGVQHILFLEQLGDELGVYVLTEEFRECFGHIAGNGKAGASGVGDEQANPFINPKT